MGENKRGKTCVVEIPDAIREIADEVNAERNLLNNLPKYSISVVIEAMAIEGAKQQWQQTAETLFRKKREKQTGRGRPRKK